MAVRVITPPAPIVTWEEAQRHLRLDGDDDKIYVEALVAAATGWIDGPAGWLGQCLGPQLLEWRGVMQGRTIAMPIGPVLEVESIATNADDVAPIEVSSDLYRLSFDGAIVVPLGASWVTLPAHRARYWAGYGVRQENAWKATVPAPIKQAILLIIGHWFANREEVVTGTITAQIPMAADALLSTFRVFR